MRATLILLSTAGILLLVLTIAAPLAICQATAPPERTPLQIGFEQRVRNEDWNNVFDMSGETDDEREQIRYRTRLWLDAPLPFAIDAHVGLAQETNQKLGKDNAFDEVFFETAYLEFRRLFSDRLRLRVGRQNFFKGEGMLFCEGGPQDGSRALYFNGFDLSYSAPKWELELIGIASPKRDRFLPRLNDRHRLLTDRDEQAIGAYFTGNLTDGSTLEAYYFIKKELHDYRAPSDPLFQPDRRVNTAGGRLVQRLNAVWTATGEFAVQRGVQNPGQTIRAWGGYGHVKRTFTGRLNPYVKLGYWAFSGGRDQDRIGDWDPIFSRAPLWGDLNLYSELYESTVGYFSNQKMAQAEVGLAPSKKLDLRFVYQHLTAFRPAGVNPQIYAGGLHRGENLQARMDFTLNSAVRGHVDFETLLPGSFYQGRDRAYFARFELIYQTKVLLRSFGRSH